MSTDPALYNVDSGRDLAKEINALVNRDKGVTSAAAPFVHTGYNSTSYVYTTKNIGSGGKVASWLTSGGALLLQANDSGVAVGVGLRLPFLTQGSIPIVGTTGALTEDHTGLFYDLPNHFLGLGATGATAPLSTLDINHMFMVTGTTGSLVMRGNLDVGPTTAQTGLHVNVSAGRVGVNISAPSVALDVAGDARVGTTTLAVNVSAGRVGVNVSAPSVALDVAGAANVSDVVRARGNVGSGLTGAGVEIQYNGSTAGGILAYDRSSTTYRNMDVAGDVITLSPNGIAKATVNPTGVGIGTAPLSLLEIAGAARISGITGTATTGTGLELHFDPAAGNALIRSFDRGSSTAKSMVIEGTPLYVGRNATHALAFYGFGGGVNQQAVGTTATTSSAALTLVNNMHDALVNLGLVKS